MLDKETIQQLGINLHIVASGFKKEIFRDMTSIALGEEISKSRRGQVFVGITMSEVIRHALRNPATRKVKRALELRLLAKSG